MKKSLFALMGIAAIFASSCTKNFDQSAQPSQKDLTSGPALDTLFGTVSSNLTLTRNTYLDGLVYVSAGVTLTINPGVTVIGATGPVIPDTVNIRNNKGTLLIQRGAKLIANGTAAQPIIWTSQNPAGTRKYGDWGGVVLYGSATIHRANGATNGLFEAFDYKPDERNRYGYGDAAFPTANDGDNSGSIQYNRFEFGGGVVYVINKEVNGFTMCGVGNGTKFSHNEVLYAGDDAMEFFGGSVNVDHVLAYQAHDDNYDFDEGFHGNLQFIIGYQNGNDDNSGSHLIESDNDASATNVTPHTNAFIANATFVGPGVADNYPGGTDGFYYDGAFDIRRSSRLTFVNSAVIAQYQPFAVVTTATTRPLVAAVPSLSDSIVIAYNVFQTYSAAPVVTSTTESNPTPLTLTTDNGLLGILGGPSNANVALASFTDFKLGSFLENTTSSPTRTGGQDLAALGLTQFVGTTERGAVRTNDVWTNSPWISIADN